MEPMPPCLLVRKGSNLGSGCVEIEGFVVWIIMFQDLGYIRYIAMLGGIYESILSTCIYYDSDYISRRNTQQLNGHVENLQKKTSVIPVGNCFRVPNHKIIANGNSSKYIFWEISPLRI